MDNDLILKRTAFARERLQKISKALVESYRLDPELLEGLKPKRNLLQPELESMFFQEGLVKLLEALLESKT